MCSGLQTRGDSVERIPPPRYSEIGTVSLPKYVMNIDRCTSTVADVHSSSVLRSAHDDKITMSTIFKTYFGSLSKLNRLLICLTYSLRISQILWKFVHNFSIYSAKIKLGIERVQACRLLANILRSRYVARTPPLEARSPGHRSNAENAPSVDSQSPASQPRPLPIYGAQFRERPPPSPAGHRPAARVDHADHSHYVVISQDGRKLVTRVRVILP